MQSTATHMPTTCRRLGATTKTGTLHTPTQDQTVPAVLVATPTVTLLALPTSMSSSCQVRVVIVGYLQNPLHVTQHAAEQPPQVLSHSKICVATAMAHACLGFRMHCWTATATVSKDASPTYMHMLAFTLQARPPHHQLSRWLWWLSQALGVLHPQRDS